MDGGVADTTRANTFTGTRISGVWGYPSAAASRARDTYLEVYLDVSHMYLECILCVTYLRVKIHCILNVS